MHVILGNILAIPYRGLIGMISITVSLSVNVMNAFGVW
jgi:hypothetical protein